MHKKVALLTCDALPEMIPGERLLCDEMERRGWDVAVVPWMSDVVWSGFDVVVIRTAWDYFDHLEGFKARLEEIARETLLCNDLSLVLWNTHKFYLRTLRDKGIPVVPSYFVPRGAAVSLGELFRGELFRGEAGERVVIKPAVSAGSRDTFLCTLEEGEEHLKRLLPAKDLLVQPYMKGIEKGEVSLIFVGNRLTHAVRKIPKSGDFRVQEEFGGTWAVEHPGEALRALGERVLEALPAVPAYARVDLVEEGGEWLLMELEAIEPELFLDHSPEAVEALGEFLEEEVRRSRGIFEARS